MKIYSFNNYKQIIDFFVKSNKQIKGYKKKLAEAAGCHQTYFSQVINGHVHLTPEQAWSLGEYWNLGQSESDYFLKLLELDRSSNREYRKKINEDLKELKLQSEELKSEISKENLTSLDDGALVYYSNWIHSAVHMFLTMNSEISPVELANFLGVSLDQVKESLKFLSDYKIISKDHKTVLKTNIHLGKSSSLVDFYHDQWRYKALDKRIEKSQKKICYTTVQSMTEEDLGNIEKFFREAIRKSQKTVSKSKNPSRLVATTLDIFSF